MMHNTGMTSGSVDTATEALVVDGPQPVWLTLNEARERAFTGEVVFEVVPEVAAYFDNGVVYYAERADDVSLGRRLLEAGVIECAQLDRGTVTVGDVEHLGRLFERDETVDRDAVLVMTETCTEGLIAELANREIASVRVTAYRHHPSGLHRWFVAAVDNSGGDVAQLPGTVEDLSGVEVDGDDFTIEWDQPNDLLDSFDNVVAIEPMVLSVAEADELADELSDEASDRDGSSQDDADVFDFSVVWPDGSELAADETAVAELVESEPSSDADALDAFGGDVRFTMPALVVEPTVDDSVLEEADDIASDDTDDTKVDMADGAVLTDDVDDDVSDDVADAVRRAISAIESATNVTPSTGPEAVVAGPSPVEPVVSAPVSVFAPPTMDMRAEVLYGLEDDDVEDDAVIEPVATATVSALQPMPTLASASGGYTDSGSDAADGNDRSSALRRLIGSLRRKDR